MKNKCVIRTGFAASLLLFTCVVRSHGTQIDPMLWEQLVTSADFVGVVECQVAGGIVAGYNVIETWKGMPRPGQSINISKGVNYWEPQFPITLCGSKFLLTAYSNNAPLEVMSMSSGGSVPLWWRKIPSDYNLPLWQGSAYISTNKTVFFDSPYSEVDSFKKAVLNLTSMSGEEVEMHLLRVLCDKYIFKLRQGYSSSDSQKPALTPQHTLLRSNLEQAKSAEEILNLLLAIPPGEERMKYQISAVLSQGGAQKTLDLLNNLKDESPVFDKRTRESTISRLRYRLKTPDGSSSKSSADTKEPSALVLKQLRTSLKEGDKSRRFGEAFDTLTLYSPEDVAQYLVSWVNPKKSWRDSDQGYVLASYFAWKCGKDRKKNLAKLLEASDDYIRVAGAVYLTFEDEQLGMKHLRELSGLKGDPGVWAALNLVRRGDKSAMPRALEVFDKEDSPGGMVGVPHRNLQMRLLVIISNSCKASGMEMPQIALASETRPVQVKDESLAQQAPKKDNKNLEWWNQHKETITLSDPWLNELRKQKID